MKKLMLLAGIFTCLNAMASDLYLDKVQQREVSEYLSSVCMDTYCGGEINWVSPKVGCDQAGCYLQMSAISWIKEEPIVSVEDFNKAPQSMKESKLAKLLGIESIYKYGENDLGEREVYLTTELDVECALDLPYGMYQSTFSEKVDLVYYATLECVDEVEAMVYELNSQK